jgi:hypothetical protein
MLWLGYLAGAVTVVFLGWLLGVLGSLIDRLIGEDTLPGDRGLL